MIILYEKLIKIDKLKKELDELEPLNPNIIKRLIFEIDCKIINNSILGKANTFTYQEIKELFLDKDKINKKSEHEQYEIIDHKNALEYIKKLAKSDIIITKKNILEIHNILFKNSNLKIAGKYRDNEEAWVSLENGEKHMLCNYTLIPNKMDEYLFWLTSEKTEHPVIIAAEAHNKFVSIHPYPDGNGRTGRLIMNLLLMKNGYLPIVILPYKRTENYDDNIKLWQNGKKENFYSYVADREIESLEDYLKVIRENSTSQ